MLVKPPHAGFKAAMDHRRVGARGHVDPRLFGDMQIFGLEHAAFDQLETAAKLRWFLALR